MTPIHSGPSTQRFVRTGLLTAMIIGFAVIFLRDGYVRYPRDNATAFAKSLGLDPSQAPPIKKEFTSAKARELIELVRRDPKLGTPDFSRIVGEPSFRAGNDLYYVGPGGWLKMRGEPGRPLAGEWIAGPKSETDIQWQIWIGYALSVCGLFAIVRLLQVAKMRVSLTEEGLSVRGGAPIPFHSMKSVTAPDYARTGRVQVHYAVDGREGFVRMDDYAVKELRPIVAEICQRTNCANPIESRTEQQASV